MPGYKNRFHCTSCDDTFYVSKRIKEVLNAFDLAEDDTGEQEAMAIEDGCHEPGDRYLYGWFSWLNSYPDQPQETPNAICTECLESFIEEYETYGSDVTDELKEYLELRKEDSLIRKPHVLSPAWGGSRLIQC